jgi:hypothetical protein
MTHRHKAAGKWTTTDAEPEIAHPADSLTAAEVTGLRALLTPVIPPPVVPPPVTTAFDGFGGVTVGGKGQPTYHVTTLADSGPGSFRDAVSQGNRYIVFDVAGRITNLTKVDILGDHITVDGSTSPGGITFNGRAIRVTAPGHHDIILSQFRHRGGSLEVVNDGDNLTLIRPTSYNVVFDHLSLSGNHDEAIGLWDSIHDVSILDCIIGSGEVVGHNYGLLVGGGAGTAAGCLRVSVFRNLFIDSEYRNPAIGWDDTGATVAPSIVGDVVNNLLWDVTQYGITVYWGGKANVVNNYVKPASGIRANMQLESKGAAFISGNVATSGSFPTSNAAEFAVGSAAIRQLLAASAVPAAVKANVGCRTGGLDAFDTALLGRIT